jgi:hypothetical protein
LDGDVVNGHIVGTLKERGIDREKRRHALRGQSAREECGVLFGDADVKVTSWMRFGEMREAGSAGHRGRDRDELLIVLREFRERLANDFRIGRRRRWSGLAGFELVFAEAVKFIRLFDRWLITFAFLRENV